ncbi:MAG: SURF1 family protein [Anaerolineae bacterium]
MHNTLEGRRSQDGPGHTRLLLQTLLSRHWRWWTLLVLAAMVVFGRLALWQMHRLEQRRAQNTQTRLLLASAPIDLNTAALTAAPSTLKYRHAVARGRYDFSRQVSLEPQNWNGVPGRHLLTPLLLDDGQRAVLVDRGWIPYEQSSPQDWRQYDVANPVTLAGSLQTSERLPYDVSAGPRLEWYRVSLEAIEAQMPYDLLPVYLLQSPDASGNQALPFRQEPIIDLSDGPHLIFVFQHLGFALILGLGYVWYVANRYPEESDA